MLLFPQARSTFCSCGCKWPRMLTYYKIKVSKSEKYSLQDSQVTTIHAWINRLQFYYKHKFRLSMSTTIPDCWSNHAIFWHLLFSDRCSSSGEHHLIHSANRVCNILSHAIKESTLFIFVTDWFHRAIFSIVYNILKSINHLSSYFVKNYCHYTKNIQ